MGQCLVGVWGLIVVLEIPIFKIRTFLYVLNGTKLNCNISPFRISTNLCNPTELTGINTSLKQVDVLYMKLLLTSCQKHI